MIDSGRRAHRPEKCDYAPKGQKGASKPSAPRDPLTASIYIFGAILPKEAQMARRWLARNTFAISLSLAEIAKNVAAERTPFSSSIARLAHFGRARHPAQNHHSPLAGEMPGTAPSTPKTISSVIVTTSTNLRCVARVKTSTHPYFRAVTIIACCERATPHKFRTQICANQQARLEALGAYPGRRHDPRIGRRRLLAEGEYFDLARDEEKTYQKTFKVQSTHERDVESWRRNRLAPSTQRTGDYPRDNRRSVQPK